MVTRAGADDRQEMVDRAGASYDVGEYQSCAEQYTAAIEMGLQSADVYYNAACCWALIDSIDRALAYLTDAVEAGYRNAQWLARDADLESLHGDERWGELVAKCETANEQYLQSINRELYDIYQADQSDRLSGTIDWSVVGERDRQRIARVRVMLDSGLVRAADDYYHAAMVFQHGEDTTDYALAHRLALKAVELDSTMAIARWLSAAAKDRYLWESGQPQWYGTQFHQLDGVWTIEPIDTTAVTDAERLKWSVPTLEQSRRRAERMNAD
jgi:hypothetical protein